MNFLRHWKRGYRPRPGNPLSYELFVNGQVANFHNDIGAVYIQPGGCLELSVLEEGSVHLCGSDKEAWIEIIEYWKNFKEAY